MEKIDGIEIDIRSLERVSSARRWWPIVNFSLPLLLVCLCMYVHVARANRVHIAHSYRVMLAARFQNESEREREKGKRWKRPWPWALKFCCIPVHWLQGQTFNVNYMHHVIYWHFRFFTQIPFLYIWLSNYYYRTYELYKIACAFLSLSFSYF